MADPFASPGSPATGSHPAGPTLQFECQVVRGRTHLPASVEVRFTAEGCEVDVDGPFGLVAGRGADAFDALADVRRRIEPQRWLLALHGARGDTYPDEASLRTGGLTVFPLAGFGPGSAVGPLHTFGPAPFEALATVEEQEAAARPVLEALPPSELEPAVPGAARPDEPVPGAARPDEPVSGAARPDEPVSEARSDAAVSGAAVSGDLVSADADAASREPADEPRAVAPVPEEAEDRADSPPGHTTNPHAAATGTPPEPWPTGPDADAAREPRGLAGREDEARGAPDPYAEDPLGPPAPHGGGPFGDPALLGPEPDPSPPPDSDPGAAEPVRDTAAAASGGTGDPFGPEAPGGQQIGSTGYADALGGAPLGGAPLGTESASAEEDPYGADPLGRGHLDGAAHTTGPEEAAHSTGPYEAAHTTGPAQAAHPTGPYEAAHITGPDQAAHTTGPWEAGDGATPGAATPEPEPAAPGRPGPEPSVQPEVGPGEPTGPEGADAPRPDTSAAGAGPEVSPPPVTEAMREQARRQPGTWLYALDPAFDPGAEVPPEGIVGAYRVDAQGEVTSEWTGNPHYRPTPVALRMPQPTDAVDQAAQLAKTGWGDVETLLQTLGEADLRISARDGEPPYVHDIEGVGPCLLLFTHPAHLTDAWVAELGQQPVTMAGLREYLGSQPEAQSWAVMVNPFSPGNVKVSVRTLLGVA